jgi:hypothetical protein
VRAGQKATAADLKPQRVGSINSNAGSIVSRGSRVTQGTTQANPFYPNVAGGSPPVIAKKGQNTNANKINSKALAKKSQQNQYNMYAPSSSGMPMTSQQSRRKS